MADLTLKYDAALPYQRDAVAAVVDLFAGQPLADSGFRATLNTGGALLTEFGLGNQLVLDDAALLTNLRAVQERNGIDATRQLGGRDYTVEMETGTGKTYVYLRTAFELNRTYGFRKFVIVVPSVAIREGVLHSIATMREHFRALYNVPFDHATYDAKQLGRLRSFATANTLQFLVINIQAFQRDVKAGADSGDVPGSANVIYRENDRLSGHRPIDFLQATAPVVILDEPQKLTGDASARAIQQLNPLCTLQYSATPLDGAVRVYRLGPIEALGQKLVKRIEVASVREESNANDAYVRLLKVDAKKQTAQVEINVGSGADVSQKKVTVGPKHDLHVVSKERQEYRSGYRVSEISFDPADSYIEFGNGRRIALGQAAGGLDDEVMREQVRETVREHLEKERRLRPQGIKVLSLFFIDRVANYRQYADDGKALPLGKIGQWFEEVYTELIARPQYGDLPKDPVRDIHDGYFSSDRKGGYRDTTGTTKDDDAAYTLIMRDKERLLSLDTPLRFIFSHSALREGWDNPNVFQICTLNESRSVTRKRQEIGRGLRLPVNQHGERVRDDQVNRLTVVANESYRDFARGLQEEFEEAGVRFGIVTPLDFAQLTTVRDGVETPIGQHQSREIWDALKFKGHIDGDGRIQRSFEPDAVNFELLSGDEFKGMEAQIIDRLSGTLISSQIGDARKRQRVTVQEQVIDDPAFEALWDHVSQRTRYHLTFDTRELIASAVQRLRDAPPVQPLRITVDTRGLTIDRKGVRVGESRRIYDADVAAPATIPDVLAYLQNETDLTRDSLVEILSRSGRLGELLVNPQAFITMATREISAALSALMIPGIVYERVAGDQWELTRMRREGRAGLDRYLSNLYEVTNPGKSPYRFVEYDSRVEEQFARALDHNEDVRFFVKLPDWFTVDTPIGTYNPDWAIMLRDGDRLFLVQETKSSLIPEDRRPAENTKIACAEKHFAAIDVDYGITTDLHEMLGRLAGSRRIGT